MKTVAGESAKRCPPMAAGRRGRWDEEEFDSAREDALFYRNQTIGILRRFYESASQIGRLPSILGRELFRARVSFHGIPSFEDHAVFVHDVEGCLARLNEEDAEIVALVGLFQERLDDAAHMLGRKRARVSGRYAVSIDRLATMFLQAGILRESRLDRRVRYFPTPKPEPPLPPPRPVRSVAAEEYHTVGEANDVWSVGGRPEGA